MYEIPIWTLGTFSLEYPQKSAIPCHLEGLKSRKFSFTLLARKPRKPDSPANTQYRPPNMGASVKKVHHAIWLANWECEKSSFLANWRGYVIPLDLSSCHVSMDWLLWNSAWSSGRGDTFPYTPPPGRQSRTRRKMSWFCHKKRPGYAPVCSQCFIANAVLFFMWQNLTGEVIRLKH